MKENLPVALQIAILAIQTGLIIFAARICGDLVRKIHLPSVLGELFAGILIGPYMLGAIPLGIHGLENGLFPLNSNGLPVSIPLYALATFGSIILLFISGLETDLRQFFRYSLTGSIVGVGGAAVSFLAGGLLGMWMFETNLLDPRSLFLGILCTATSVGITARILSDRKSIDSPEGTTIMAAAVIDDVLGIICLAVVMGIVGAAVPGKNRIDWGNIGAIALKSVSVWLIATILGLCFAHKIAAFLKKFRPDAVFSVLALGLALLAAGFFETAGLAMIIGAYVLGLSLSKTDIAFSIRRKLGGISNFLVPVFFVVMGMLVDVKVFTNPTVLKFGLLYSLLAVLAKIIGCALPAGLLNFNLLGSLRIGIGMIPRGEVALIIAGIGATTMMTLNGQSVPIINSELFGIAVIMTLATTVVAPPLLSFILGVKGSGVKHEVANQSAVYTTYSFPSENIRDLILNVMHEHFRNEGFRNSPFDRDGGIINFRRGTMTFTLNINYNNFCFESDRQEAALIKTVMFETFIEIQQKIAELKSFASSQSFNILKKIDSPEALEVLKNIPLPHLKGIRPEKIIIDLKADNFENAVAEMIKKLEIDGEILDSTCCINDIMKRENIVSTCMPGGIALPHARSRGVSNLTYILGISRNGCTPSAPDTENVHIFLLTLSPPDFDNPYLEFIAHAAGVLNKKENTELIKNASTAEEISRIFAVNTTEKKK